MAALIKTAAVCPADAADTAENPEVPAELRALDAVVRSVLAGARAFQKFDGAAAKEAADPNESN